MNGYLHPDYAASLADLGTPRLLPRSKAWVLVRPIAGTTDHDAMGCYPLFACQDWSGLQDDLEEVASELVCLSAVTEPLGEYDEALLRNSFQDVVRPFKQHHIANLSRPLPSFVSGHHRRNARRALQQVGVERVEKPEACIEEWVSLYANLIKRHGITGLSAFSKYSLAAQLMVPGAVVFRATSRGQTVGMVIWYVSGDVAYYHLAAYSDLGYELRASFALFWSAIEFFTGGGFKWINLGAGAGVNADASDGLNRFKRGWSTGTRTAYFCGRIFNHERYTDIVRSCGNPQSEYFPAYRAGR